MQNEEATNQAGLIRRLAAACYDALLIIALMAVASLPMIAVNKGTAIAPGTLVYQAALIAVSLIFYCGFWLRGGQTLGMKAWRMRLISMDGQPLTLSQVLLRYAGAWVSLLAAGLGFLWIVADSQKLAWHDHWSRSRIIVLPRDK